MIQTKMRRLKMLMFALLVFMGTMLISNVSEAATIKYKGKSGTINWSVDTNGHLLLQGKGDYEGTGMGEHPAWYQYREEIKSATVKVTGITNCANMFDFLQNMKSIDLSGLDTSNVTNMKSMFSYCGSLEKIDVSKFNTSKVKNMGFMFSDCYSLKTLDVSNFDTSNVEYMVCMFYGCTKLTDLKTGNFKTSKVYDMSQMFDLCNARILDMSSFDMSGIYSGEYSANKIITSLHAYIKTPINVNTDIKLPSYGIWKDGNGKVYQYLPKNMKKSITLTLYDVKIDKLTSVDGQLWMVNDDGIKILYTGLVNVNGTYYYVVDGVVNNVSTLVKYKNKWYYVSGGKISKATTLVKYGNSYYYVSGGTINYSTTLVKYGNKYYYVTGGKHVKATTLVKYAGNYWYVKNGVLNKTTTLVKYNNKYYYVQNGKYCNVTTLVKYGNKYYFVQRGIVNFNYTGTFVYNGVRWKIVKGVVTGRA